MILYCDYCGTVYGADCDHEPTRKFCSPACESDFGSGPTLPPDSDDGRDEARQRGEDAAAYADDEECHDPL